MRKFVSILFILLCAGFDASAQKFLDDLTKDNQGEGKVTVSESSEIDELVNGKEAPEQPTSITATVPATEEKKRPLKKLRAKEIKTHDKQSVKTL